MGYGGWGEEGGVVVCVVGGVGGGHGVVGCLAEVFGVHGGEGDGEREEVC